MKSDPLTHRLEFAVEVAWRAGRATLAHFQTGTTTVETKADRTPVTAADRAAERLARELIDDRFPGDGVLGEEYGAARPNARHRWVIDPIDGTRSFVHGVPLYAVLIALERDGEPVLGVIHMPALDETVFAARGEGCWWDGRRASVSDVARLEDATVVTTDAEAIVAAGRAAGWDRLRARTGLVRTWGDAYGYALVATGRAEAMLDPVLARWDAAPLGPIVEEAGGVFTARQESPGGPVEHVVATNAALAGAVRSLIAPTAAGFAHGASSSSDARSERTEPEEAGP
ncbi:MAG: histidinol-phosphatase [Gemmatimonadota bacterium]